MVIRNDSGRPKAAAGESTRGRRLPLRLPLAALPGLASGGLLLHDLLLLRHVLPPRDVVTDNRGSKMW
jgi:hypothetical protein